MSSNTAAAADPAKAKKGSSKKLIIIAAVVALLVVVGGGGAWFMMSRSAAAAAEAEGGGGGDSHSTSAKKVPPTFMPMDVMVVNLADPGGDRFAQIGITLELDDPKTADLIKQNLPTIRSAVLMVVSQRTADELLSREGKEKLSYEILREVARPLGFRVPKKPRKPSAEEPADAEEEEEDTSSRRKGPIRQVLFSSFIVQ